MNLFIRSDANIQIGTGHLMRCLALAQAWKNQGGKVTIITACENGSLRTRITDEGFQVVTIENPYPDHSDLETTLLTINNSSLNKPWIVLDGYHFDNDYQQSIKNNLNPLLVIDDIAHLDHYVADIILNQNIYAEELNYSCEPKTELLLGTEYVLLRDEFLEYKNWKRKIHKVAKKILVTMGGGDSDNVTLKVLEALDRVDIDGLEIKVVAGASNPHLDILKKVAGDGKHNIELLQNVSNMSDLMSWADLAVSAGGSTCWELVFMGLPTLSIVTAENQRRVAGGLNDYGVAINLGWYTDVSTRQIANKITTLLNDRPIRIKMNNLAKELVDGDGLYRLITKMDRSEDHFNLRLANKKDAELVWHWANEPSVRKNSFNPEYIKWKDHLKWFENKLSSNATRIWILEYDNKPIGQIRYDRINNTTAEVSFIISKNRRGMGIGTKLLQMTSLMAFKDLKVEKVRGVMYVTNVASSKAFHKAGFKLVSRDTISNNSCYVYMKYNNRI